MATLALRKSRVLEVPQQLAGKCTRRKKVDELYETKRRQQKLLIVEKLREAEKNPPKCL
jgi:hypothetical protein